MLIKIKSLGIDAPTQKAIAGGHLYKDIMFDLSQDVSFNSQLNRKEILRDIAALFDIEAVKNSIRTAFLTSPGQKILNPTYGIDIRKHLFEPINDFTTDIIKDDIETLLPEMEPRVEIKNVSVIGDEDANTYYITMQINVPSLDVIGLSIKSELNSTGYTIV